MKREEIINIVESELVDLLGVDPHEVTQSTSLKDLGMDSLEEVECIMTLEDEFDLEVPDDDAMKWRTVGDVVAYVESALP